MYNIYIMENVNLSKEARRVKALLERYAYGKMPPAPKHLSISKTVSDRSFAAGKAELIDVTLTVEPEGGACYDMAVRCALPQGREKCPTFIHIHDDLTMPSRHQPTEELCDGGFAVVTVGVNWITAEINKRKRGLARALHGSGRKLDAPGAIAISAWCAMRAVDYLHTLNRIDTAHITVVGHGIYAASALLCGAYDERVAFVISNSAGPGGAALGEKVRGELFELVRANDFLFCKRFAKLIYRGEKLPVGGDALLSLIAPRAVLLDNAADDVSGSVACELCSALLASKHYEALGIPGIMPPVSAPDALISQNGELSFTDGRLAYRRRAGTPYLSREDWRTYMNFVLRGEDK